MASKRRIACDYCGAPAKLIDSKEIYGEATNYGMIWTCSPCDARVGVHQSSPTFKPLGRLANGHLRRWKTKAHNAFDPLWKQDKMTRNGAYAWLSEHMNIQVSKCHIGMFNPEQCKQVVKLCDEYKK